MFWFCFWQLCRDVPDRAATASLGDPAWRKGPTKKKTVCACYIRRTGRSLHDPKKCRIPWELMYVKIRCTFLRVPVIRAIVYLGLHWGPPNFGKLPYEGHAEVSG